jgi:hypothetical protein
MNWTAHQKDVILDNLMAKQSSLVASGSSWRPGARVQVLTRAAMWDNFTSHDNCFYQVLPGSPSLASWTCDGTPQVRPNDNADWTDDDVDAILCGGLAGIGVGGALASGLTGPWTWLGIGAGAAVCMWQDNWERAVENRPAAQLW